MEYGLPTKPRKPGDRRALHVQETVEAEAMPVEILRDLLRAKEESYLPEGGLEAVQTTEESEREGLELLAATMSWGGADKFVVAAERFAGED